MPKRRAKKRENIALLADTVRAPPQHWTTNSRLPPRLIEPAKPLFGRQYPEMVEDSFPKSGLRAPGSEPAITVPGDQRADAVPAGRLYRKGGSLRRFLRHLLSGCRADSPVPYVVKPSKSDVAMGDLANPRKPPNDVAADTAEQLRDLTVAVTDVREIVTSLNTSLHTRLNTIENIRLRDFYEQMHELAAALMRIRAGIKDDGTIRGRELAADVAPARQRPFDAYLASARAEFPDIYPMWAERLEATREAFLETKIGNAAHAGDPRSELFRSFVEVHARGRILDIGCGVFGRPYYLSTFAASRLSGIDPLEPLESPDFNFIQGLQEYLPWPDRSFSTVISATSLDHCLSLNRSLTEIHRVLHPDGRFLLWIDSVRGSPPFAPEAADFKPADRYHLFHFDTAWFEPMLDRCFEVVDRLELRGLDFSRVMYCLKVLPGGTPA